MWFLVTDFPDDVSPTELEGPYLESVAQHLANERMAKDGTYVQPIQLKQVGAMAFYKDAGEMFDDWPEVKQLHENASTEWSFGTNDLTLVSCKRFHDDLIVDAKDELIGMGMTHIAYDKLCEFLKEKDTFYINVESW